MSAPVRSPAAARPGRRPHTRGPGSIDRSSATPQWTWSGGPRYTGKRTGTHVKPSMLERSTRDDAATTEAPLGRRQALFFTLVGLSIVGLIWLLVVALSVGSFGALDTALVAMFAVTLPWTVISFWNATIGLLIMRFARDPVVAVTPIAGRVRGDEPITASTALLACIRNEPPARVVRCLSPMLEGLATPGVGARFHLYVLSDT